MTKKHTSNNTNKFLKKMLTIVSLLLLVGSLTISTFNVRAEEPAETPTTEVTDGASVEGTTEENTDATVEPSESQEDASNDADESQINAVANDDDTYISDFWVTSDTDEATNVGDKIQFTSHVKVNEEGEETTDTKYNGVTWSVDNTDLVTIDQNGLLTVNKAVEKITTITVKATSTYDSQEYFDYYIVINPVEAESLKISGYSTYLITGNTVTLSATVKPDNTVDKSITWSSSDESVATVDENGIVTAKGQGKATITAKTSNGVTAEQVVEVYSSTPKSVSVEVWVTNQDKNVASKLTVPTDGTPVDVSNLEYSVTSGSKTYIFSGVVRYRTSTTTDWSTMQNFPAVKYLRYNGDNLQYSTDGSTWTNAQESRLAGFYGEKYSGDTSDTDVNVVTGDWPGSKSDCGGYATKTITISIINDETTKEVYNSGSMMFYYNKDAWIGQIQFNCDQSLYEVDYYTVTRSTNSDGSSVSDVTSNSYYVKDDTTTGISVRFNGVTNSSSWYYDTRYAEHYVVTAHVKAKTFKVEYNLDGGTSESEIKDDNTYRPAQKDKVTVTSEKPTKEGYIFSGWTYAGKLYQGGNEIQLDSMPNNGVLTLTASWVPESSVVKYKAVTDGQDTAGGYVVPKTERIKSGAIELNGSIALANTGYKFVGWYLGDEQKSTEAKFVPDINEAPGKTYVAKFEKLKYTITTSVENGKIDPVKSAEVAYDDSLEVSYSGNNGFELYSITVDGEEVSLTDYASSYKFTAVKEAHSIAVVYKGNISNTDYYTINDPSDSVYDGKEHKWVPEVTTKEGTALTEGTDYEVTYDTEDFTNVKEITVTITGKGNYTGTVTKAYKITKAPLTVTTESGTKVYDGEALTAGGTITGFVEGETYTFEVTGSQTKVGSSDNTYTLTWDGTAKEGNYEIKTETIGTLTVTESEEEIVVTTTGGTFTYDGQAHGATVTVSELPAGYTLETATSSATATDVTTTAVTATADTLVIKNAEGEDVTSKLNIKKVDGSITITPATLTVTTPDGNKVYDGTALTAEGTISGFVNGETATFTTTGTQTDVGESENSYTLTWDGTAKESNYTVSETKGTLTVTKQSIVPGDKDNLGIKIDDPSNFVYDGKEHKWSPSVTDKDGNALVEGKDYEVTYDTKDFTDVNKITVTITGKGNYTGTVTKTYEITKAPLTITTESASKVYDGKPLTASGKVEGLVEGETVEFETTGSQTKVGSSPNTYTIKFAEETSTQNLFASLFALVNGTDATAKEGNYEIVAENIGTLTVTEYADEIVVTTTGGTYKYDGQAHGATVTVTGLPESGYTVQTATSSATATDVTEEDVTATADNLVIVNAEGEDVTSELNITKVDGTIKITPASVIITTESATKVYDGTALTAEGKVEGLVNGETVTFEVTGSQTEVGSSNNTYSLTWDGTAKESNYQLVGEEFGLLTVTEQSIDPSDKDSYKGITISDPTDVVYNGKEQKQPITVTDKDGNVLVEGTDYKLTYTEDVTNVGTVTVTVEGIGNYKGTVDKKYNITKAPLKVTTESATKQYDGKPLTAAGKVEGLVNDETVTFVTTGSQTEVGSSSNTYTIKWDGTAKESNYEVVSEELGTLTVTAKPKTADTSDSSNTGLWAGIFAGSLAMMLGVFSFKRRLQK